MIAYKLFKMRKGKLYPLYVLSDKETPIGEWVLAREGELQPNGKVKAKLGNGLAYRPGWHCANLPTCQHIGKKMPDGSLARREGEVWAEVEVSSYMDYNDLARENGWRAGKWAAVRAYLKEVPVCGWYYYKTNAKQIDPWIICGAIKVNRILSEEEVEQICREHNVEAQKLA